MSNELESDGAMLVNLELVGPMVDHGVGYHETDSDSEPASRRQLSRNLFDNPAAAKIMLQDTHSQIARKLPAWPRSQASFSSVRPCFFADMA